MKVDFRKRFQEGRKLFLKDQKQAKWAVLFVFAYFVLLRRFFITTCPTVLFTGLPCPGCGMTRAFVKLLHLDFAGAWTMHPFIYPFLFFLIWFGIRRYVLGIADTEKVWKIAALIAVLMIVFYIWRMLRYFPGDPPMSYYYGNVLLMVRHILQHIFNKLF